MLREKADEWKGRNAPKASRKASRKNGIIRWVRRKIKDGWRGGNGHRLAFRGGRMVDLGQRKVEFLFSRLGRSPMSFIQGQSFIYDDQRSESTGLDS